MIKHTVCRLCSACCPAEVKVEDGKLIGATRKSFLPPEKRLVCPKLLAAPEIVYSPERITNPIIRDRKTGKTREVSWEDAMGFIADRLQKIKDRHGPQAVAWLRGMAADWGTPWDYANRLMNAFGSPNTIGNGSVCHVAREMAHWYVYGAMTIPMVKEAKCIVIWGKNDRNTAPGMAEAILFAREKGAKLIVVDPVRTFFGRRADIWLPVKPAHDGLLVMAMLRLIVEKGWLDRSFIDSYSHGFDRLCDVLNRFSLDEVSKKVWLSKEDIEKAAKLYATGKPACIIDGNGLDMQLEVFDTTRAIAMLRAITGNIDVPGGDFIPQPVPVRNIQLRDELPEGIRPITSDYSLFDNFHPNWGRHAQSCLIDAILDEKPYAVKALVVQSGNPVVTMTESSRVRKAFEKLDFMVCIDPFRNRTSHYADVILPATTCFEKTQINRAYLRNALVILQDAVIGPVGNSWPDWKIIFELAKFLGLGKFFPWESVDEALNYQLEPAGITVEDLRKNPDGIWVEELRYEKYKSEGFNTPSGKVEFASKTLEEAGYPAVPFEKGFSDEPISFAELVDDNSGGNVLIGISGERTNRYTHTQFHNVPFLRKLEPEGFVEIHPQDAERLGIEDFAVVSITTPKGQVKMKARRSDVVRPGVVRIAWGWGEVNEECGVNNLTDDSRRNPLTCTPSNRSFYCRVDKVK
ncbi:molybdopterin-containing oxidoreductase family protein [Thermodesulforhabdus norvegica]|uniref:Anaerobic selenocysteine-containing dehydrogenase n=1 Tax=Thermodesulforhabdus norvegica TaxID=39841 RepID=A0A1I4SJY1_9BACT|nr:molybdopterin-dependent oxidoreductase [Thermodesulforhabdus norvegica]SFM64806.1 Anaerobic selenocysteine-containing dehydrogenase [Thermodesulforhabdus norvegica]